MVEMMQTNVMGADDATLCGGMGGEFMYCELGEISIGGIEG